MPYSHDLLVKLMDIHGESSHEKPVRDLITAQIRPYVDEMQTDKLGNLICHHHGKGPRIMLAAHMDEVGLMVRTIDPEGFISVVPIGGVVATNMVGNRVHIRAPHGTIHGIITTREISAGQDPTELPAIKDLIVDTGQSRARLTRLGVQPGTYLELENETVLEGDLISGKALDDRIGCYILLETAKICRKLNAEVYYVFTVQEETELAGAKVSSWLIQPDFALAVEATVADDTLPNALIKLGKGPAITVKDESMIANKQINNALKRAAKKLGIAYQLDISEFGTTDASVMSISRRGIPASVLAVPIRNIHTCVSLAYLSDVHKTIRVLCEFLAHPPTSSLDD